MKSFVGFFAILFVVAVAADHHHHGHDHGKVTVRTHEDLAKFRDHCIAELSVPADLADKYKHWEYPDDATTHCYMKCMFEQFGFFDAENGFDVHKVHHQLVGEQVNHDDAVHAKIAQCAESNEQKSDACAWAYRAGMCFIKENLPLVKASVKSN